MPHHIHYKQLSYPGLQVPRTRCLGVLRWRAEPHGLGLDARMSEFEPLLDVQEAADLLRIHPKTVQAWARAGRLPCLRMGKYWRFRKSALEVWVAEQLESSHQSRRVS